MRTFVIWLAMLLVFPSMVFAAKIKDNDTPKSAKVGDTVRFSVKVSGDVSKAVLKFKVDGPDIKKDMRPIIGKNKWELDWKFNASGEKKYEITIYDKKGKKADDKDGKIQIGAVSSNSKSQSPPVTPKIGSVTGRVHVNSANGPALAGVSVNCGGKSATTDGNGYFKIDGITSGNQTIDFSKGGFEAFQSSINVVSGQAISAGDRWLNVVKSADKSSPSVSSFDRNPTTIKLGGSVTINFRVTDSGGSGLKQVELWRSANNRDWAEIKEKRQSKSGGNASGTFTDVPPSTGTYYYGMHVVDNNNNWVGENGPKRVTVIKPSEQRGDNSEQCVSAVRALLPWTDAIRPPSPGYAKDWIAAATKAGFPVNKNGSECNQANPCVLIYKPEYGSGIDSIAGHAAVYFGGSKILDSNGICGGYRKECNKQPDFNKAVYVIHPINKNKNSLQLSVPFFSQTDDKWKDSKLGGIKSPHNYTIGNSGCGIASLSMVLNYFQNNYTNPSSLNNCLTNKGGYSNYAFLKWNDVCLPNNVVKENLNGSMDEIIKNKLSEGKPVIADVRFKNSIGKIDQHFIVITGIDNGVYKFKDPMSKGDYVFTWPIGALKNYFNNEGKPMPVKLHVYSRLN